MKSMIQHSSCYRRAGADLKTQRQVIPQNYFLRVSTFTLLPFIMPSRHRCRSQNSNVRSHSSLYQDAGADLKIQMSSQTISSYVHTKLSSGNESSNQHSHSYHPYSQHYRHCPPAPTIIAACLSHYIRRVVNPFQNVNLLWCQQL